MFQLETFIGFLTGLRLTTLLMEVIILRLITGSGLKTRKIGFSKIQQKKDGDTKVYRFKNLKNLTVSKPKSLSFHCK